MDDRIRAGVHLVTSETPTVDNLFQSMSLPQWHVAWTLGVGAGLKVWRGRIVRVSLDVDALQLAKARQTWVPRARMPASMGWIGCKERIAHGASPCITTSFS